MVYFHGISHGWWSYAMMVGTLSEGRTVLLIDLDNIKVASLNFDAPPPKVFVDGVHAILKTHEIPKCTIVGHSFGSITATWMMKHHPRDVAHLILVDPVAVLLAVPDVAVNFLYRNPSKIMEWLICLVATLEITVAHTLYRNFDWHENAMWLDDVPTDIATTVIVAGKDEILNGPVMRAYAEHFQCNGDKHDEVPRSVLYFPDLGHGQACLASSTLIEVNEVVQAAEAKIPWPTTPHTKK
jgi:pimeloyl-ACP methyl ester carboxylesterase